MIRDFRNSKQSIFTQGYVQLARIELSLTLKADSDPARMEALDRLSAVEGITAAISSRSVGGEGYLDEREMAIPDSSLASSFGGRAFRGQGAR